MNQNRNTRPIVKDRKYLEWVCNKECYVCELLNVPQKMPTQAHHLQGKYRIGAMIKDDSTVVPLCYTHHHELTFLFGERKFWEKLKIDPWDKSKNLRREYEQSKEVWY